MEEAKQTERQGERAQFRTPLSPPMFQLPLEEPPLKLPESTDTEYECYDG